MKLCLVLPSPFPLQIPDAHLLAPGRASRAPQGSSPTLLLLLGFLHKKHFQGGMSDPKAARDSQSLSPALLGGVAPGSFPEVVTLMPTE